MTFLEKRFSRSRFAGFPLTLFVVSLVCFAAIYASGALDAQRNGALVRFDFSVTRALTNMRTPVTINFFSAITAFGSWMVMLPFAAGTATLLWLCNRGGYVPGLALELAGNQITVNTIKPIFARARPEFAYYSEPSYSFPSGHSAIGMAFFGLLTWIVLREHLVGRSVALCLGAAAILLLGTSRLVLGEHVPSDVLGGYLIGGLWAAIGAWWTIRRGVPVAHVPASRSRQLVAFAVLAATGLVVWFAAKAYLAGLIVVPGAVTPG